MNLILVRTVPERINLNVIYTVIQVHPTTLATGIGNVAIHELPITQGHKTASAEGPRTLENACC